MGFENYHKNLIKEICGNFREARKSCSTRSIHDFRVGIKRLRSLLELLSIIDGGLNEKKHEQKLRPLFKSAGKVRELQVTAELIRNWLKDSGDEVSEYYNYLKLNEDAAKRKFVNISKSGKTSIFPSLSKIILKKVSGISADYLKRFIGRSTSAALLRIDLKKRIPSLPLGELHNLRIEAKDARYRLQALSAIQSESDVFKKADDWLRGVHRAIGQWHDMIIAQGKLDSFLANDAVKPLYSPEAYEHLKKALNSRGKDSYRVFLSVWNDKENALGSVIEQLEKYNI
ncbi:MAG: CHAD domain-containing protein [Candidatus Zixiibacteriota bacterium]